MLKFVLESNKKLDISNISWILSISGILASKMYYDDLVEGLLTYYGFVLSIDESEVAKLERYFLSTIEFKTLVTMGQYEKILE